MNEKVIEMGKIPEGAVNVTELKRMLPELIALAGKKQDASELFASGIDAAAFRCGASKAALRKLVTAMHKDKTRATLEDAVEVADLIEAVAPAIAEDMHRAA